MSDLSQKLKQSKTHKGWEKVGIYPHHGIALALGSLHTEKSSGTGEFLDLIPLIDWCADVGFDLIQLLPLNDSGTDPSPYNALSSRALHPIYLSLHALPYLEESSSLLSRLPAMHALTSLPCVDYGAVLAHKIGWLRDYFSEFSSRLLSLPFYRTFLEEHPWGSSYALFKVLKDELSQTGWSSWPETLSSPTTATLTLLQKEKNHEISFYLFLQAASFYQLQTAHRYAKQKKILLKGDIPILISPDSVDVWLHRPLFDLDYAAGAPPDLLGPEGQYWGFPLFAWEQHRAEQFAWWKERLQVAATLYDLYRIDHVVGFFRIWAIPQGRPSNEGNFSPPEEERWIPQGKELLEMMIEATSMLPIAEDLGVIPPEVRICLSDLGICGTKVICWEKEWEGDQSFTPLSSYNPLSTCCLSTHDSETFSLWWQNTPEDARLFADLLGLSYHSPLSPQNRKTILKACHKASSLFHINLLQEYLALFPELIHATLEQERINVPGTISQSNWTYRFRISLEKLSHHEGLKKELLSILKSTQTSNHPL